jgi:hypothetical protein
VVDEKDEWAKVDTSIEEARKQLEKASIEEQFQAIGLICRETLISLAQIIYVPERHDSLHGDLPSKTDAKKMIEAYLSVELEGGSNEAYRKYAKAAFDLANDLQHRRNATYRDAAQCVEATAAVVKLLALISGRTTRATSPDIQVDFSCRIIQCDPDEHLYQLDVAVTNLGMQAINPFKLEFLFPDLDSVPLKWVSLGGQRKPSSPLVEIDPSDTTVTVLRDKYMFSVSYRSKNALLPHEKLDIGKSIGLRYRFNYYIYDNLDTVPQICWTLYADNMLPKQGKVSLARLNSF